MRVISWDVGISNLAYCILDYDKIRGGNPTIVDWNLINLIKRPDYYNLICCGKKNDGSQCDKISSYYMQLRSNKNFDKIKYIGFCKTHLDQSENYWTDSDTDKLFSLINNKCCRYKNKRNQHVCNKDAKYKYSFGPEHSYYCNAHYKTVLDKKKKEFNVHKVVIESAQKYPTIQIQISLVEKLDQLIKHFVQLNVTDVVIENQPSLKNPKMKAIASTLFDYFLIRGYFCDNPDIEYKLKIDSLRFFSPSNKLKVDNDNTLIVFKNNKKKNQKYKLTKQLGIKYTYQLLENDPDQIEFLELFSKKDDLCDAYLQGRYYLEYVKK